MTTGGFEAVLVAPPGASPIVLAIGVATSAAQPLAALMTGDASGHWLTMCASVPCHVVFGPSNVGAATTSHMYLPADAWIPMHVLKGTEGYVRVIRAGSDDGNLYLYRSSR